MKVKKFDLEIYPLDLLRQAAIDYSKIAKVVVVPSKKYALCSFLQCKADEQLVVKEFGNYVIDLIGSRGKGNADY
jgi:hypothetical protein